MKIFLAILGFLDETQERNRSNECVTKPCHPSGVVYSECNAFRRKVFCRKSRGSLLIVGNSLIPTLACRP